MNIFSLYRPSTISNVISSALSAVLQLQTCLIADCFFVILQKCVTAFGKNFHLEHFRCTACDAPFGDNRYYEKDGKAYCRYVVWL